MSTRSELDFLPDIPPTEKVPGDAREYIEEFRSILHEQFEQDRIKEWDIDDPRMLMWLTHYLDADSEGYCNPGIAAKLAGYKYASMTGYTMKGRRLKVKFKPVIDKWLEDIGFTEEIAKMRLVKLTEATKPWTGKDGEERDVSDNTARLGAIKTMGEWLGLKAPEKVEHKLTVEEIIRAIRTKEG